jgi:hypothetical protein
MTNNKVSGVPVWVRVPGIIVLVLVGVVVSSIVAGAVGLGGASGTQHAPDQRQDQPVEQQDQKHQPGSGGGHRPPAGGHGG